MLKLYMHCGGHHVDREAAVTTPTPQRTRTWVPVPHGRLLGLVEQTLAGTGMRVVSEAHGPISFRSRWSVTGSETPRRLRQSTTCRSPRITSPGRWSRVRQKRVKKRGSIRPFCLAEGRNPKWPRIRKPLFCRGLRPGARWCKPAEWRIGVPHLGCFPTGTDRLQGREGQNRGQSWQPIWLSKPNWPG